MFRNIGALALVLALSACSGNASTPPSGSSLPSATNTLPTAEPQLTVVPYPSQLVETGGQLTLPLMVNVSTDTAAPDSALALESLLATLNITPGAAQATSITLALDGDPGLGNEGYALTIDDNIAIHATTDTGLFYGVQTLRQLLPATAKDGYALPHVDIADIPTYPWRGSMVDVARNFVPLDYLKQHVDRMALFKLNKLHLHLTDDQGWRVEITSWPNLTVVGSSTDVGGGDGGFYTQDEIRDLVAYAAQREVEIIAEVDLPGHTQAALASYPELACDDVTNLSTYTGVDVGFSKLCLNKPDVTYPFVTDVLTEIADLFPSEYIHIGGDEIQDPLYPEFIEKADAIAAELGRKVIAWEEASAGDIRSSGLLQLWNDDFDIQPAVDRGNQLILSPCSYAYIDHANYEGQPGTQTWCRPDGLSLERVYSLNPQSYSSVMGVEGAMWAEFVESTDDADNRLWPRLAAIAELGWSKESNRDYAQFTQRLGALRGQLDAMGVNYYAEPQLGW